MSPLLVFAGEFSLVEKLASKEPGDGFEAVWVGGFSVERKSSWLVELWSMDSMKLAEEGGGVETFAFFSLARCVGEKRSSTPDDVAAAAVTSSVVGDGSSPNRSLMSMSIDSRSSSMGLSAVPIPVLLFLLLFSTLSDSGRVRSTSTRDSPEAELRAAMRSEG